MPFVVPNEVTGDVRLRADVCIIGSGAGGAVAAHELARAGLQVVVLEKGAYHVTSEFKSDPAWSFRNLYAHNGVTAALGLPPVLIPYGECVGGTTVINSGTVFRIPAAKLAAWHDEHGVEEAGALAMDPFYSLIEAKIGASESVWPALGEMNRRLHEATRSLGYAGGPLVRNAPRCAGCGACVFGCPSGAKQSMLVTFVPAAEALGVTFYTECRAERLVVENGRAVGVEGRIVERATGVERGKIRVDAKVVLLSAGAFGSPIFLQNNDYDDASGLVGQNLRVHPAGGALARLADEVEGWKAIPQGYHVSEWAQDGIMLEGGFGPPEVMSLIVPGFGDGFQARMADYRKMISFGLMVEDRDSVGSVRSMGDRPPLLRYQLGEDDKNRLVFGWKKVIEILFAAGAVEVYPAIHGFDLLTSAADLARIVPARVAGADLTLSAYHPMGTCRMGRDPATSVVDSYLESHALRRLFIVDASVFPTALGVNPQASIMAFAARTADYLVRNKDRYFSS